MIRCENLAFGHGRRMIGEGVDFTLTAGEVLCLLGPNGSGKTTLFKTLLGLLPPLAGRVLLGDTDIASLSRAEIARRVAFVPQGHSAYFPFRVLDVVLMGRTVHLRPFALPGRADREAATRALEILGLAALAERPYTEISGGERQLTLIARALAQGASTLVMDEPTASLDFGNHVRVLRHVAALRGQGHGIVLSTHDPSQAHALADRVALLDRGRLTGLGPPADVATAEALGRLYDVEVSVERLPHAGRTVVAPRL